MKPRSAGRWLFGASLVVALGEALFHVLHPSNSLGGLGLAAVLVAGTAGLSAVWCFVRGREVLPACAVIFALLAGGHWAQKSLWGSSAHQKLLPAAALAAYALCLWTFRREPPDRRERLGQEAACGVVGAAYFAAALAKLQAAGLGWGQYGGLALLIAERSGEGYAWQQSARLWIAQSPAVCAVFAGAALCTELSAILFAWPPARRFIGTLLIGLHLGIGVLMGYWYPGWILLLGSLAYFGL